MGRLDEVVDMTGSMDQTELNSQNISQMIDELNRNSDQLDALSNTMNIIGRGSTTMSWDGTTNFLNTVSAIHGFPSSPLFFASFVRSDDPGVSYFFPHHVYSAAGAFQQRFRAYTNGSSIFFQFFSVVAGSAATFTFSYYIIQQPAQVPTGA